VQSRLTDTIAWPREAGRLFFDRARKVTTTLRTGGLIPTGHRPRIRPMPMAHTKARGYFTNREHKR